MPATYVATLATDVFSFTAVAEKEFVQEATKKPCYTGFDDDTEQKSINKEETHKPPDGNISIVGAKRLRCTEALVWPKTYELPDGNISTVGAKRFRCAEVLFRPSLTSQRNATWKSARTCTQMSCCQAARPCFKASLSV